MRVVLDTNVLVSGLISSKGPPGEIQRAWRRQGFELVTSAPLLHEFLEVLTYPRIRKRLYWSDAELSDYLESFLAAVVLVTPTAMLEISRDPDDNRILEAAYAANADYIVTGDADLLVLREFSGIAILAPAVFVRLVAIPGETD